MEKNYSLSPKAQEHLDRFATILRKYYGVNLNENDFLSDAVDVTIRARLKIIIEAIEKGLRVTDTGALMFFEHNEERDREQRELLDDLRRGG